MNLAHILTYAVIPIIVVMGAGYIAGKKGVFNAASAKTFNKLVLDFALPAALFVSIATATREDLVRDIKLTFISLAVIMICFMMVYYVYKYLFRTGGADAAIMALISGSPSIGFLGFAVLEPIFGATAGIPAVALVVAIVSIVVNAVGIPVGLTLLNKASNGLSAIYTKKKHNIWKPVIHALAQPVAWAPILAVVLVIAGIKWPDELSPSFLLIKQANASVAVFAAGITLSSVKVSINLQVITGAILKLIVMPLALLAAGILFHMDYTSLQMMVMAGALPPAFSGIIIADEYDTYVAAGTSSLTLSVILYVATCPLWIWITASAHQWFGNI